MTIRFDSRENEWVSETGEPVCQDHGEILPCKYHGRAFTRHVRASQASQHDAQACEWCKTHA